MATRHQTRARIASAARTAAPIVQRVRGAAERPCTPPGPGLAARAPGCPAGMPLGLLSLRHAPPKRSRWFGGGRRVLCPRTRRPRRSRLLTPPGTGARGSPEHRAKKWEPVFCKTMRQQIPGAGQVNVRVSITRPGSPSTADGTKPFSRSSSIAAWLPRDSIEITRRAPRARAASASRSSNAQPTPCPR